MSDLDRLLSELNRIAAMDDEPFPYEDCRKLQRMHGADPSFIPDLDVYLSELAGYRTWGKRIAAWPDEKIDDVAHRLGSSFFDRFPAHAGLRDAIESGDVPDLQSAIGRADETRAVLHDLLNGIRHERASS